MKLTTLCYIRDNGRTLMIHRVKKDKDIHNGKYNGLGGKFEEGETPDECVKREVLEESGLVISNPVLKGIMTFPAFKDDEDYYVFLFEAYSYSGELMKSCSEGVLEWIDDDKLDDLNLWEGDRIFFEYMKKYRFFSAKFEYANKILVAHKLDYHEA